MSDIVERLRLDAIQFAPGGNMVHREYYQSDVTDAADEIERLTRERDALKAEVERLRGEIIRMASDEGHSATFDAGWRAGQDEARARLRSELEAVIDQRDRDIMTFVYARDAIKAALSDLYAAIPDNEGGPLGEACRRARAALMEKEGGE